MVTKADESIGSRKSSRVSKSIEFRRRQTKLLQSDQVLEAFNLGAVNMGKRNRRKPDRLDMSVIACQEQRLKVIQDIPKFKPRPQKQPSLNITPQPEPQPPKPQKSHRVEKNRARSRGRSVEKRRRPKTPIENLPTERPAQPVVSPLPMVTPTGHVFAVRTPPTAFKPTTKKKRVPAKGLVAGVASTSNGQTTRVGQESLMGAGGSGIQVQKQTFKPFNGTARTTEPSNKQIPPPSQPTTQPNSIMKSNKSNKAKSRKSTAFRLQNSLEHSHSPANERLARQPKQSEKRNDAAFQPATQSTISRFGTTTAKFQRTASPKPTIQPPLRQNTVPPATKDRDSLMSRFSTFSRKPAPQQTSKAVEQSGQLRPTSGGKRSKSAGVRRNSTKPVEPPTGFRNETTVQSQESVVPPPAEFENTRVEPSRVTEPVAGPPAVVRKKGCDGQSRRKSGGKRSKSSGVRRDSIRRVEPPTGFGNETTVQSREGVVPPPVEFESTLVGPSRVREQPAVVRMTASAVSRFGRTEVAKNAFRVGSGNDVVQKNANGGSTSGVGSGATGSSLSRFSTFKAARTTSKNLSLIPEASPNQPLPQRRSTPVNPKLANFITIQPGNSANVSKQPQPGLPLSNNTSSNSLTKFVNQSRASSAPQDSRSVVTAFTELRTDPSKSDADYFANFSGAPMNFNYKGPDESHFEMRRGTLLAKGKKVSRLPLKVGKLMMFKGELCVSVESSEVDENGKPRASSKKIMTQGKVFRLDEKQVLKYQSKGFSRISFEALSDYAHYQVTSS